MKVFSPLRSYVLLMLILLSSCSPTIDNYPINNKSLSKPLKILATMAVGLSSCYGASDVGMIAYFDQDCPDGWEEYDGLVGRVPVGAGNYIGTAEDGRTEAIVYSRGSSRGEVYHTLTLDEIPTHNHENGNFKYLLQYNGANTICCSDNIVQGGEPNVATKGLIRNSGGGLSHNNMPPYLVLTPCIKTKEPTYALQRNLSLVESEVNTNTDEIEYVKAEINDFENIFQSNITSLNSLKLKIENLERLLNLTTSSLLSQTTSSVNEGNDTTIYAILGTLSGVAIVTSIVSCMYSYKQSKNKAASPEYDREVYISDNPTDDELPNRVKKTTTKGNYQPTNTGDESD